MVRCFQTKLKLEERRRPALLPPPLSDPELELLGFSMKDSLLLGFSGEEPLDTAGGDGVIVRLF